MKIAVNKLGGPFDYAVSGEREAEAAAELERQLEQISRDYHLRAAFVALDIVDARKAVAEKYGVTIKPTLS